MERAERIGNQNYDYFLMHPDLPHDISRVIREARRHGGGTFSAVIGVQERETGVAEELQRAEIDITELKCSGPDDPPEIRGAAVEGESVTLRLRETDAPAEIIFQGREAEAGDPPRAEEPRANRRRSS
ncbi:hypothetical protein BRC19_01245 [Candidatus Saccharibacteria bacterium QS_5_54_17]|nr:MAG: hypothetical protein BRC19_01245 [Candidatus Saccharibacteria bacterium QS_5_54_17]